MLVEIGLPYGGEVRMVRIPKDNLLAVAEAGRQEPVPDLAQAVRAALRHPVGTAPLSQMVSSRSKVAIIVENWMRPMVAEGIVSVLAEELAALGVHDSQVCLVVANGVHWPSTKAQLRQKLGGLVGRFEIVQHHRFAAADGRLAFLGVTRLGTPIWINGRVAEADLRLCVSQINLNPLAGYTGGAKAIIPGVAGYDTINRHHELGASPGAIPDLADGNPFREDLEEGARLAGTHMIVNAVLNPASQEVVTVVAGDYMAAHREGVMVCDQLFKAAIPERADIVIASANPRESSEFGALWGLVNASYGAKPGGTIIFAARCQQGISCAQKDCKEYLPCSSLLHRRDFRPEALLKELAQGQLPGWIGAFLYQCARAVEGREVILVSDGLEGSLVASLGMRPATDIQSAGDAALSQHGGGASVLVVPLAGEIRPAAPGDGRGQLGGVEREGRKAILESEPRGEPDLLRQINKPRKEESK